VPNQRRSRENGKRGGRPKGRQSRHTLNKQAAEEAYRAFLQAHHQRIWTAALEAACGSFVLFRVTKDGPVQVTDPREMATLLAQPRGQPGERLWYLEARRPDPQLMKELHHRLMGPPRQTIELETPEPISVRIIHQEVP